MSVTQGFDALYVHIPFCRSKCGYCDFASWATSADDPLVDVYLATLLCQLHAVADAGLLQRTVTAYVGGGTPTLLGARRLFDLIDGLCANAPCLAELSCEANPDTASRDVLEAMRAAGTTRVSFGVQSLEDDELMLLGRVHTSAQAQAAVRAACTCKLDVSCDLMCAIPGQTDESWRRTVSRCLELGIGHLSVYPLAIEEGTPFDEQYGELPIWNDEDVQACRMDEARRICEDAGLGRYEVASYARPGCECAHNKAYWTGRSYLGLGVGAASMMDVGTYLVLRDQAYRLPAPTEDTWRVRLSVASGRAVYASSHSLADISFEVEFLNQRQACAEDLMLGMRLVRGVGTDLLRQSQELFGSAFATCVAGLEERGLACQREGRLVPTHRGWLLGNELFGALWELAGEPVSTICT